MMPAQHVGAVLTRQPTPGIRPYRPGGLPRNFAIVGGPYRTAGPRPRAPLVIRGTRTRLPNLKPVTPVKQPSMATSKYYNQHISPAATPIKQPSLASFQYNNQHLTPATTPVKHPSLSTPRYNSPNPTPVIKLEDFSPYPASPPNMPAPLGVSVARENVPSSKHGLIFPPGISVSKITSTTVEGPTLSLPILAKALSQLGEVDGRKSLVQFQLTKGQVRALNTLGVREEGL